MPASVPHRSASTETALTSAPIAGIGHNSGESAPACKVELRLFNSIVKHGRGEPRRLLSLPAGSTVGDVVREVAIPVKDIYLIMVNGRDISKGTLADAVNLDRELEDGDCLAISGPVPFSFGYGAPIV